MINQFAIVFLLFLTVRGDSSCPTPQSSYQFANGSIFLGLEDVQRSLDMVFNDPLDEIEVKTGSGLLKNTYTIKSITVQHVYKPQTQVQTIGDNSITKKGGMLQLKAYFTYHWREIGISTKEGTCEGYGRFNSDFEIVNSKIPSFSSNTGALTFSSTVQEVKLTSMTFQKLTGEEPTATAKNMIDSMMNSEPTQTLSSLKWQIQERIKTMNKHLTDFVNQIPAAKFSADHPYSWEGRRVDFDYTLTSYSLKSTGEMMSLRLWPLMESPACYTLASFGSSATHYAVSKSIVENSWNQLKSLQDDRRRSIRNIVVDASWQLPNFFFQVKDLSWFIPNLTDNYEYSDPISVQCTLNQADPPAYTPATETFDTVMTYDCYLNGQNGATIMEFTVDAAYQFTIEIGSDYLMVFQVSFAQFDVTTFKVVAPYTFTRETLLGYYVGLAANSMQGTKVFGSSMLSLPAYFKQPAWKMSDDNTTIFFYDSASTVQTA